MHIIDPHHHLWGLGDQRVRHPWLVDPVDHPMGDYAAIRRDYLAADFLEDAKNQSLVKSVHVEAGAHPDDVVAETAWLQEIADHPASRGFPHGIVAHADLAASDVETVLARHCEHANMRGVRYILNFDPDDPRHCVAPSGDMMDDSAWRGGYALLEKYGLSFDLQLLWPQMADALRLLTDFPDVPVILDHAGMPVRRDTDYLGSWRRAMANLAVAPNLAVKISGLGMFERDWTADSIRPQVLSVIETFGVERCMFASNFPVDRLMGSYDVLWDAFKTIVADFTADERDQLFHGTAERCYRL
jgi:predicted TIM-barrel fold metal-dependent hydrolase